MDAERKRCHEYFHVHQPAGVLPMSSTVFKIAIGVHKDTCGSFISNIRKPVGVPWKYLRLVSWMELCGPAFLEEWKTCL
eukprot:scaffold134869_cov10-Tisochrysis_lutea.AAC.1